MKRFMSAIGSGSISMGTRTTTSRGGAMGRRAKYRKAGFTLIELMVVVAIVAILAAIAYPSYTQYVLKTRRTAAKACVSEYANYMERYYTTNLAYDKDTAGTANVLPALDCASNAQTGPYYDIVASDLSPSAFKLTATPKDSQGSDKCGALGLDQTGARTAAVSDCW